MASVVRFSPDLSAWLGQSLSEGQTPAKLVQIMIDERMDPRVARAIVDAFVLAHRSGLPLPLDSLTIEDEPPEYVYGEPRLPRHARFETSDRIVPVLSRVERPVVVVLGDVFSPEECAELIELARPRLVPSTIVNPYSGQDEVAAQRTSLGMFFRLEETPLIAKLDRRVAELMQLPLENGEGFQVLHYPAGAEAAPHFDFLAPSNDANRASLARSGQRVSTLITYLNEVESGGATTFPKAGLTVLPVRGNAVYFEYCDQSSQLDHRSLHAGAPVQRGEKWVATKWMRQRRFVSAAQDEARSSKISSPARPDS
ncbi:MAG: 2OG-Fe(II) oxygenase [Pseudomonadota bacterium]